MLRCFTLVFALLAACPSARLTAQEPRWYERLRFDGDFRLRHETFFQSDTGTRGRLRIRLRAGFTLPLTSTLTTGFRLASAEPGSVTSHNVTLTGALTPKNLFIDRAFLAWTPNSWLSITGGKFGLPLQRPAGLMRSELVFDDEVAPEGIHEQITLVSSRSGTVRRLMLLGEQWSLAEVPGETDAWMLGGQAVLDLALGGRATATLTGGFFGFLHQEMLARARNNNSALLVTNGVVLADGTILEGGQPLVPPSGNPFLAFVSDFKLVNGSIGISVDSVFRRMPLQLYLDLVHNSGAEVERNGLWSGLTVGALRRPGDWSASVLYTRVERESVVSMYSYSDLGLGGTNVEGPVWTAQYRMAGPLTLSYRHHYTRPLIPVPALPDRRLHRILLDAGVSF
ncbi:MAG TPA: putative porin [Gemmatimonadales bacterium]